MFYLITSFFIVIIYIQVKKMIKKEEIRELAVYLVIMAIAVFYSWGILLDWELPKTADLIREIYRPISDYIFTESRS